MLNLGLLCSQHGHVSARLLSPGIKLDFFYCRAFETNEKHCCLFGAGGGLLNDLLRVFSCEKWSTSTQTAKPCPAHNARTAHMVSYTINIHLLVLHYSHLSLYLPIRLPFYAHFLLSSGSCGKNTLLPSHLKLTHSLTFKHIYTHWLTRFFFFSCL